MAEIDALEPASPNPLDQAGRRENRFEQFDPDKGSPNRFDKFNPFPEEEISGATKAPSETSATGAFRRGLTKSILPTLGSFPAMAAGAELGAAAGAFGGPAAPVTVPVGGVLGALAGGFLGATAIEKAQSWALSKLPDSWTEAIGMDERQAQLDEKEHGTASFIGGLMPFALTMRPGAIGRKALPENATTYQKIMANPVTARVFGGAVMGGIELGQEVAHGDADWSKVAISTGFGVVFNKPTRLGERLMAPGQQWVSRPARYLEERAYTRFPYLRPPPTVTQAADMQVMGPGITEAVFQGSHEQATAARMTAQDLARTERTVMEPPEPVVDVHAVARQIHPELFEQYDRLTTQREEFRNWIRDFNEPPADVLADMRSKRADLERKLEERVTGRGGYASGPEARRLRAQIRETTQEYEAAAERARAYAEGRAQETPDLAAARRHLLAVDAQIRDMLPEVQAAYRRTAEARGAPIVEAPAEAAPAGEPAAPERLGATLLPAEPAPTAGAEPPVAPTAAASEVTAPQSVPSKPSAAALADEAFIAVDVEKKLIAAGRPPEEALAAAKLIAARYIARASRMEGVLGTPRELYEREGAEIRGVKPPPIARTPKPPAPKPVERAPEVKPMRGPRGRPEETWSLLEFLANRGGINPQEKLIGDVTAAIGKSNKFVPGFGHLVRKEGMTLERAREAATEAGYLTGEMTGGDSTTIRELLDAMDAELRGTKQYRTGVEGPKATQDVGQREHELNGHIDSELEKVGVDPATVTGKLRDRMLEIMDKEKVSDPTVAYERAVMEDEQHGIETGGVKSRSETIPDWDVDERGAARSAGEGTEGQREPAREGTREAPREPSEANKEPKRQRELAQEQPVDEYFQRKQRGLEGQTELPGTAPISDAELAQRKSDQPLKPTVEQRPMEEGLFGTDKDQKELFQGAYGKIALAEGRRSIITLMRDANASTFIHESGHDFLEQVRRDSSHPEAPEQIRNDAETVRDWLGVHSLEDLKTRHHEKFARGFEQYIREGVAPSPELAGVFARFKEWLLQIYQTIKGLGKPINDDIRQVFDRMLTAEPQSTVMAPERAGGPTLSDIHAADALHTEPHEAEVAADRVAAERARFVSEPPPEIANEITPIVAEVEAARAEQQRAAGAEPGAEVGGGTERPSEVATGGTASEPVAERGGVGTGGGTERTGGSETASEGGNVSGEPAGRRETGANAGNPLAATPRTVLGAGESPFIDKAGNIRVENLTKEEDVARAIHDAADANDDFIGDRRGVTTDGQMHDLADALGMDFDMLMRRKVGEAFNAEQTWAARKLLVDSATQVSAAMKKAAIGTDEDVMAYALAAERHRMIQGQVAGITAEWGRAGRAFRALRETTEIKNADLFAREATGKTLFQLKQEAQLGMQFETPQQVSKFMYDAQRHSFGRMMLEYWINSILSGFRTQMTNIVGNTILAVQHFGPETALAAAVGSAQRARGREGSTVRLGEIGAALQGARRGAAASLIATRESMEAGAAALLPGEKTRNIELQPHMELVPRPQLREGATMDQAVESLFGMVRGLRDGIVANAALLKAGGIEGAPLFGAQYSLAGAIPDIAIRGVNVLPLGTVLRTPGRMLGVADTFFRTTNYSMAKNAIAYRTAANEGLEGAARDARIADLLNNFPEHLMEQARDVATEMTLMTRGGKFVQALNHLASTAVTLPLVGEITPVKFVMPFISIAGQIMKQSIVKRTPVGLLSSEIRADLMGKNGTVAQDFATARMLFGTMLSIGVGTLAMEGLATGSGPKKPDEAAMWRLAGNQAHSVRIGDIFYDVHQLGPIGMLVSIAADLYEVAHKASEGDMEEAATHLQHAFAQNLLDESFMRGPAELIQAIEDPERYGGKYIRNFLSGFVPFSGMMGQTARSIDPYTRKTRDVTDAIINKIPFLSQTLLPSRDVWGEPMPSKDTAFGITSVYAQKISKDPVNQAMVALGISLAPVDKKIRNVELEPEQYDDYARLAGRMSKQRLDVIVRSPDFSNWPSYVKQTVIEAVVKESREAARGLMLMKYPAIVIEATAAKQSRFTDPAVPIR